MIVIRTKNNTKKGDQHERNQRVCFLSRTLKQQVGVITMKKSKKSWKRKCFYVIGYLLFMAITFCVFGMEADVWNDDEFHNL